MTRTFVALISLSKISKEEKEGSKKKEKQEEKIISFRLSYAHSFSCLPPLFSFASFLLTLSPFTHSLPRLLASLPLLFFHAFFLFFLFLSLSPSKAEIRAISASLRMSGVGSAETNIFSNPATALGSGFNVMMSTSSLASIA